MGVHWISEIEYFCINVLCLLKLYMCLLTVYLYNYCIIYTK